LQSVEPFVQAIHFLLKLRQSVGEGVLRVCVLGLLP
jgi:hypothetical protein